MKFDIRHLEEVDSTNSHLLQLLEKETLEEGTVIVASHQNLGRGHGDNYWESDPGKNLTLSLLLKPWHIEPANQFILNMLVSLAITKVLEKRLDQKQISIKWPNDIYIGDKKIAGILIQNSLKGNHIAYAVVGIGLNVNQVRFKSATPNPTSMKLLQHTDTDLKSLLDELLQALDTYYRVSYAPQYLGQINNAYLERLYRLDTRATFRDGKTEFQARLLGIGEFGRLKLELDDGQQKTYGFKELVMVI